MVLLLDAFSDFGVAPGFALHFVTFARASKSHTPELHFGPLVEVFSDPVLISGKNGLLRRNDARRSRSVVEEPFLEGRGECGVDLFVLVVKKYVAVDADSEKKA